MFYYCLTLNPCKNRPRVHMDKVYYFNTPRFRVRPSETKNAGFRVLFLLFSYTLGLEVQKQKFLKGAQNWIPSVICNNGGSIRCQPSRVKHDSGARPTEANQRELIDLPTRLAQPL